MSKDQAIGGLILVGSIVVLGIYAWMLFAGLSWLAYGIVITAAVVAIMGIIAWIGWTMATTPPPAPLEPLDDIAASSSESSAEKPAEKGSEA
ncbi:transcriptional regulator [Candidatus Bathyarchaeota archaeon]|jgi:predicted DNA-binding transcriptional regulator|nr:transcriptional regulator [Candidatus Bathyarchaeota archaeon]